MSEHSISWMRTRGFLWKEILQIRRDPSSLLLGILMPIVLLLLFGYGVSLDPKHIPIALVIEDRSPESRDLFGRLALSRYFDTTVVSTMREAEKLARRGRINAIVRIPENFLNQLSHRGRTPVQVIVNGVDANRASLVQGYVEGAAATWINVRHGRGQPATIPAIEVRNRMWFNPTGESTNFLVPGLLTLIMTLIGTLLTALVIAREWERGTMERILATPLRPNEILIGKFLPYFFLGMVGLALSVILSVTLFNVPLRGSVVLLILFSSIFLTASIGLGLVISAKTRVQFLSAMVSVIVGFLPAFFLSDLLFNLQSTPAFIQAISHIIPARYFVSISQTLFLAGNVWSVLLPDAAVLALMALILLLIARRQLVRKLPLS